MFRQFLSPMLMFLCFSFWLNVSKISIPNTYFPSFFVLVDFFANFHPQYLFMLFFFRFSFWCDVLRIFIPIIIFLRVSFWLNVSQFFSPDTYFLRFWFWLIPPVVFQNKIHKDDTKKPNSGVASNTTWWTTYQNWAISYLMSLSQNLDWKILQLTFCCLTEHTKCMKHVVILSFNK